MTLPGISLDALLSIFHPFLSKPLNRRQTIHYCPWLLICSNFGLLLFLHKFVTIRRIFPHHYLYLWDDVWRRLLWHRFPFSACIYVISLASCKLSWGFFSWVSCSPKISHKTIGSIWYISHVFLDTCVIVLFPVNFPKKKIAGLNLINFVWILSQIVPPI